MRLDGKDFKIPLASLLALLAIAFSPVQSLAQTGSRYDYYRYPASTAFSVDPLGVILGRMAMRWEFRLTPNYSRIFEAVYQPDVHKKDDTTGKQPAYTIGAMERIYLVDNAALLHQFAGLGAGLGMVGNTISVRISVELGYKAAFGAGETKFFIEPEFLLDCYLVANSHTKRILPYLAVPFGVTW